MAVSRIRDLSSLSEHRVGSFFEPGNELATAMSEFEYRVSQRNMAVKISQLFREGGQLLVEAGTGIGKTLAYLVPAVLSGQRVVISTGTKNLQEQLFYKDIPLLRKAMKIPFKACLMKGRGNYLCLTRYAQFSAQPAFTVFEEAHHFKALQDWSQVTKTGDNAEIQDVPENLHFWKYISSRSENCTGKDCSEFERCYITKLRQEAADSDIVIVNHHLLFADLMVREGSYGEVIPDYDYVVLDEAHQIEDVATQYFGLVVSSMHVEELVRDIDTLCGTHSFSRTLSKVRLQLRRFSDVSKQMFGSYVKKEERYRLSPDRITKEQSQLHHMFVQELSIVRDSLEEISNPDEVSVALVQRIDELFVDLKTILEVDDVAFVSWCERRQHSVVFRSSPIQIAPLLKEMLLSRKRSVVMTSATLSVEGSFNYMSERLGVSFQACELFPSPFDYQRQAMFYIPKHIAAPADRGYRLQAVGEIEALLAASRGRAFVLFTSFANMHSVRNSISEDFPYPILVQGDLPRSSLLTKFKKTPNAVLFATSSFWEGVDVMGQQLSCVIIDKLPFAFPGDPLTSARIDFIESSSANAFETYQVPMAVLSLKQGLGRLIRSTTDRGVVALLDSRITNKAYGQRFLASLPPYRLTHDREEVVRFLTEGCENLGGVV